MQPSLWPSPSTPPSLISQKKLFNLSSNINDENIFKLLQQRWVASNKSEYGKVYNGNEHESVLPVSVGVQQHFRSFVCYNPRVQANK